MEVGMAAGEGVSARLQPGEVLNASSPWRYEYLLSFVGSVRFHTPGYSMGVRQAALLIQRCYRGHRIRSRRRLQLSRIVRVQALIRGWLGMAP